ncbi:AbrB/MazE/SpoVT family DNA-binding domain-containing protein [Aquamicrobium sp. LC103]|uniref:AbrB/MazE/SpoVT family DNA-binding domain-containing protein n=1 Tax=Aquamicrobium sp. LC103 TaxID=1120658 RepID=UPI00063EAC7E|nr:AbrB/MazE/SpoVT family DNA-binding domain-containing protein [Aquamicrobium sp. LC103]TKT75376.1 AbrB/MazE/SpoVT family DNA-binding domain-containing protein [Aquamicrobium sp. LC103]
MRVTEKGQVTIPKPIRDRLGIEPGSEVEFVERNSVVVLQKRPTDIGESPASFDEWAESVADTFDTKGMDGMEFIDWLRGPRDDIDSR